MFGLKRIDERRERMHDRHEGTHGGRAFGADGHERRADQAGH
jgi:hypothetical protein